MAAAPTPGRRGRGCCWGGLSLALLALALASRRLEDPGFSTSGDGSGVANWLGLPGAWAADIALYLFGFSAWWCVVVGLRHWLSVLADSLRADVPGTSPARAAPWRPTLGLVLLLAASTALEWTRVYGWEARLPGPAGGVVGFMLGPTSMQILGFAGSGAFWIALLVAALPLALSFSWLNVADTVGGWVEGVRERRSLERERAEDLRIGELAQREREIEVDEERVELQEHVPLVIEPAVLEVPKSERVARERQKPLFNELANSKLPQVDLLDKAPGRVESVTPESLENDQPHDREEAGRLRG